MDKALGYMLELWPGLMRFVDDARIPLDYNQVERDLCGVVVGRKNHDGSKSLRGTQVAATFYTLTETEGRHGVDPRAYLLCAARHALYNPGEAPLADAPAVGSARPDLNPPGLPRPTRARLYD